FLLSEEEVFRTIVYSDGGTTYTTNAASMDLTQNLYGSSVVLFADANARRTSGTYSYYWLRSPRGVTLRAALVVASTGTVSFVSVYLTYGVRPAFRMNLS
ncbi:MAG: DUF6273 domain-containing protein, partial [Coriobacteriales bacterium]|nr:DUF6273 domain-containing protein [Coriobacteriales bacterium]